MNLSPNPVNEDPLDAMEDETMEDSPLAIGYDSHLVDVPEDNFPDSFLNPEPIQELELSFESTKRRNVEEGDEGLS